jgi:hypothetical protein
MDENSNRQVRDELSNRFADTIGTYQQDHRALMDALYDDGISMEAFEMLSARIHEEVNTLKRVKMELKRQRDVLKQDER